MCKFDGSVSCPGLYGGLYGQNLPYKFKKSYGDFRNRNFEKSHRTTGPRSDLRPDSWSWANSGLDSTFSKVETESFWVTTRGAYANRQYMQRPSDHMRFIGQFWIFSRVSHCECMFILLSDGTRRRGAMCWSNIGQAGKFTCCRNFLRCVHSCASTVALTDFSSRNMPAKVHLKKKSGGRKTRR